MKGLAPHKRRDFCNTVENKEKNCIEFPTMLQLQSSYPFQDAEQLYARGCATDRHIAFSTADGAIYVLTSNAQLLYIRHDEQRWASSLEIASLGSDPSDEVLITAHGSLIKMYTLATG